MAVLPSCGPPRKHRGCVSVRRNRCHGDRDQGSGVRVLRAAGRAHCFQHVAAAESRSIAGLSRAARVLRDDGSLPGCAAGAVQCAIQPGGSGRTRAPDCRPRQSALPNVPILNAWLHRARTRQHLAGGQRDELAVVWIRAVWAGRRGPQQVRPRSLAAPLRLFLLPHVHRGRDVSLRSLLYWHLPGTRDCGWGVAGSMDQTGGLVPAPSAGVCRARDRVWNRKGRVARRADACRLQVLRRAVAGPTHRA